MLGWCRADASLEIPNAFTPETFRVSRVGLTLTRACEVDASLTKNFRIQNIRVHAPHGQAQTGQKDKGSNGQFTEADLTYDEAPRYLRPSAANTLGSQFCRATDS
jgi:hypothetical protein